MAHEAAPRPGTARRPRIVGRSHDCEPLPAAVQAPGAVSTPARPFPGDSDGGPLESLTIDCDRCAVRGHGCGDCMVTVLLGGPPVGVELDDAERRAISVLVAAGLVPPLRMVTPLDTAEVSPGRIRPPSGELQSGERDAEMD